jgi:hypothetical protein
MFGSRRYARPLSLQVGHEHSGLVTSPRLIQSCGDEYLNLCRHFVYVLCDSRRGQEISRKCAALTASAFSIVCASLRSDASNQRFPAPMQSRFLNRPFDLPIANDAFWACHRFGLAVKQRSLRQGCLLLTISPNSASRSLCSFRDRFGQSGLRWLKRSRRSYRPGLNWCPDTRCWKYSKFLRM